MSRKPEPTIFEYLTQREWKTCFALVFVARTAEYADAVDLRPFIPPGHEDTWEAWMIAAVRYLGLEHGFRFEAVRVREEDQEILALRREPICFENRIYWNLLSLGKLPDIPSALATAIKDLNEGAPSFNTEPLADVLSEVEDQRRKVLQNTDPEALAETEKTIDAALGAIGVARMKAN